MLPYTARDALVVAIAAAATLAIAATHSAIERRRERRRRLRERREGVGRYDTGCPPEITKNDVDSVEMAYLEARYPGHAAAGRAFAQINEAITQAARALTCGYAIRNKEGTDA